MNFFHAKKALGLLLLITPLVSFTDFIHWNWHTIDTSKVGIEQIDITDFFKNHAQSLRGDHYEWLWGTATAAHQVEGNCTNNQWCLFENKMLNGAIVEPAGIACDHWKRYKEDIQLMKDLGVNS